MVDARWPMNNRGRSAIIRRPSSIIHRSSAIDHRPSAIGHRSSVIDHRPWTILDARRPSELPRNLRAFPLRSVGALVIIARCAARGFGPRHLFFDRSSGRGMISGPTPTRSAGRLDFSRRSAHAGSRMGQGETWRTRSRSGSSCATRRRTRERAPGSPASSASRAGFRPSSTGTSRPPCRSRSRDDSVWEMIKKKTHLAELEMDGGATETVLVRDIQWDHLGKEIIHLDFARVSAGESIETEVPIELRGTAPGVAEGGVLEELVHAIEVTCRADAIPDNDQGRRHRPAPRQGDPRQGAEAARGRDRRGRPRDRWSST